MNKVDKKTRNYLVLAMWLLVGLLLVIGTYTYVAMIQTLNKSEVAGFLNLFGFGVFVLAGMMLLVSFDLLYLVLFLKWIFIGRKQSNNNGRALILP